MKFLSGALPIPPNFENKNKKMCFLVLFSGGYGGDHIQIYISRRYSHLMRYFAQSSSNTLIHPKNIGGTGSMPFVEAWENKRNKNNIMLKNLDNCQKAIVKYSKKPTRYSKSRAKSLHKSSVKIYRRYLRSNILKSS